MPAPAGQMYFEKAAKTMMEWSDKQHFLNTVYERFFQGYSVKLADTMVIVYTPQLDVLLVTGDAYVDHPAFGMALLGPWLVRHGFRVGIVAQPRSSCRRRR